MLRLLATVFFRLVGQFLLDPGSLAPVIATFVLTVPLIAVATHPSYAARNLGPSERPAAAACVALPGMLLDIASLSFFGTVFPNLTALSADALFGAWLLWAYALILLTGFFLRHHPREA